MKLILSTIIPFLSLIHGQSTNNGRSGEVRQVINSSPSGCIQPYQQCGGKVTGGAPYTGETCCTDGYICTFVSEWWSQCDPNTPDFQNNPPAPDPAAPAPPAPEIDPVTGCKLAYAQCGGQTYKGEICCIDGTTCTKLSEYWSQCQPDDEPIGAPGVAPPNPPRLVQIDNNRGNGASSASNRCLLQGELCGIQGAYCCSGLSCIEVERGNGEGVVIQFECLGV